MDSSTYYFSFSLFPCFPFFSVIFFSLDMFSYKFWKGYFPPKMQNTYIPVLVINVINFSD